MRDCGRGNGRCGGICERGRGSGRNSRSLNAAHHAYRDASMSKHCKFSETLVTACSIRVFISPRAQRSVRTITQLLGFSAYI